MEASHFSNIGGVGEEDVKDDFCCHARRTQKIMILGIPVEAIGDAGVGATKSC